MVPVLKIRAIVKMRVQIHERTWVHNFNNTPQNPAEFTMICAPKVFFHLVSLWGLIQQADSEPTRWALMRVSFTRGTVTLQKTRKRCYICTYIYPHMYVYICMHPYTLVKWLFISSEKGRKCFYVLLYIIFGLKEKKNTIHKTTKHVLVSNES